MPEVTLEVLDKIRAAVAGKTPDKTGRVRVDCPACSGSQSGTLSVRLTDGLFNCYRCHLKGRLTGTPTTARTGRTPKDKLNYILEHSEVIPEGSGDNPYLEQKGVQAFGGLRRYKKTLLVIFLRIPGKSEVINAQIIDPQKPSHGNKIFLKGLPKKGAAFCIGSIEAAPRIYFVEGYATGAAVHLAAGLPVVCCMDAGNLRPVAEAVRRLLPDAELIFAADNDRKKPPGSPGFDEGFRRSCEAARAVGGKVAMPEAPGMDFNDLFLESGPEAVKAALDKAEPPDPDTASKNEAAPGENHRPEIKIIAGRLHEQIGAAEAALVDQGEQIFSLGSDYLVRPIQAPAGKNFGVERPGGQTRWQPVTIPFLVDRLTFLVKFLKYDRKAEDWIPANCPRSVAEGLLNRAGLWRFSVVSGLAHTPLIRWDGSILEKSGLDPRTGIFVNLNSDFPPVPEHPARSDAEAAAARLRDAIKTFPFDNPISEAVALSGFLTAIVRPVLDRAPLFLITSPVPGSGKGQLVDGFSILATGAAMPVSGGDEKVEELQAVIEALLLEGAPAICIDNLERPLKSSRLCQLLSQETLSVRIKGFSKTVRVNPNCFVCATGNNAVVSGDMARRTLLCSIDPGCERPEQRRFETTFQDFCRQNRGRMVQDVLTILKAWHLAGRSGPGLPKTGSYEMWSRWCREPLTWLGLQDPWASQEAVRQGDLSLMNLRAVFEAWHETFGSEPKTCKAAYQAAVDRKASGDDSLFDVLDAVAGDSTGNFNTKRFGAYLRKFRGRILGNLQLIQSGTEARAVRWVVLDRSGGDPPAGRKDSDPPDPAPDFSTGSERGKLFDSNGKGVEL
jgi:putative DNA primase/helicase